MEQTLHEDKTFEKVMYTDQVIKGREFQGCTFKSCDFMNSDFSFNTFHDCTFEACNLSMMKLKASTLNNAVFKGCKVLGVNFSECSEFLFHVRFESCVLDYASFAGRKMQKTKLTDCSAKEATFSLADLSGSVFEKTDLWGAVFNRTNLTAANFITAFNYTIDPEINNIKKASFSMDGLTGLLVRHNINVV